jgi:hypothetical protein
MTERESLRRDAQRMASSVDEFCGRITFAERLLTEKSVMGG